MVLGLIDFLLGGKKNTKAPKSAQVQTSPLSGIGGGDATAQPQAQAVPDGTAANPTENTQEAQTDQKVEFQDSTKQNEAEKPQEQQPQQGVAQPQVGGDNGQKKSISGALAKIHDELKSTNERITGLVSDVKNVQNDLNTIGHRVDELEESRKNNDEKLQEFDNNMTKFLSLYELINNQYNPFVDQASPQPAPKVAAKQEVVVGADGSSQGKEGEEEHSEPHSFDDLNLKGQSKKGAAASGNDLDSALLELETLNIEEAAGDAVPLTVLKNNTNSLVTILSWLEYLIKRVGVEETRNTLTYYTETLRWITPEVYFDLDKYLKGMKVKEEVKEGAMLSVRDHIVSLYFISKLNEKTLDEKLTRAVLQIIKQ